MDCGQVTRPAKVSSPTCWHNFRCSKTSSQRLALSSGRWWNSRRTTHWPPLRLRPLEMLRVERVIICTPDKDLAQCVSGTRIVQLNRRTRVTLDEAGVVQKFGVSPASIPDYLALVGDAADGYPGLPGWGAKSSAAVLAKFLHLEAIPLDYREWRVNVANAFALADTLCRERDHALLFRRLATLRTDIALFNDVDELRWKGPTAAFDALAARLDAAVTEKRPPTRSIRTPPVLRSAALR